MSHQLFQSIPSVGNIIVITATIFFPPNRCKSRKHTSRSPNMMIRWISMALKFLINNNIPIKICIWIIFTVERRHRKIYFSPCIISVMITPWWIMPHTLSIKACSFVITIIVLVERSFSLHITNIAIIVIHLMIGCLNNGCLDNRCLDSGFVIHSWMM